MDLNFTEPDKVSLTGSSEEALASIDGTPGSDLAVSVRVAVRVRPNPRSNKERDVLQVAPVSVSTIPATTTASGAFGLAGSPLQHASVFHFDEVYHAGHGQADVYVGSVEPLVAQFLQGYNATLLAYGQTASGKTHTMGTSEGQMTTGMIGRSVASIFRHLQDIEGWVMRAGFLEIYNEQLLDLLDDNEKRILLRQDPVGRIYPLNATMPIVSTGEAVLSLLQKGSHKRSVGSTLMNGDSSRSHAIFTLKLEHDGVESKLHFVDLAGSERIKKTGAIGGRAKEGISINGGLLALSNVIGALGSNHSHVPYRESKLTRLLQDSLGGDAYTTLIACVSPASGDIGETLDTLRYAARARRIKIRPTRTAVPENLEETVAALRQEVAFLKLKPSPHVFVQSAMRKLIRRSRGFELELMQLKKKYAELQLDYAHLKHKSNYVTSQTQTHVQEACLRDPLSILEFASNCSKRTSLQSRRTCSTRKTINSLVEVYMPSPLHQAESLPESPTVPELQSEFQTETQNERPIDYQDCQAEHQDDSKELNEQVEAYQRRILYLKDKLKTVDQQPPFDMNEALQDISRLNDLVDHLHSVSSFYTAPIHSTQTLPFFFSDDSSQSNIPASFSSSTNIDSSPSFAHIMELSTALASTHRSSFPWKPSFPPSPALPPLAPVCSPSILNLSQTQIYNLPQLPLTHQVISPPLTPVLKRFNTNFPKPRPRKTLRELICI